MKRFQLTAAILLLTLLLSACGTTAAPAATPAPEATAPAGMSSTLPSTGTAPAAETTAPEATAAPEENEAKTAALALVGEQVSKLYEAIGEPISTDYASSCLGPGQDGELVYDGFTVYTYKEGNSEVIQSVD